MLRGYCSGKDGAVQKRTRAVRNAPSEWRRERYARLAILRTRPPSRVVSPSIADHTSRIDIRRPRRVFRPPASRRRVSTAGTLAIAPAGRAGDPLAGRVGEASLLERMRFARVTMFCCEHPDYVVFTTPRLRGVHNTQITWCSQHPDYMVFTTPRLRGVHNTDDYTVMIAVTVVR